MHSTDVHEAASEALAAKRGLELSADGEWWLAGHRWLPTRSADTRWRWDGRGWWPLDPTAQAAGGTTPVPSLTSLSVRDLALAASDLEAGRLPALSVKSGRVAFATTPVVYRPRWILSRGLFWGLFGLGDWLSLVFVCLVVPVVFLLHPYGRWVVDLLPGGLKARGGLPVTEQESRWIRRVQKWAVASGLGALALWVSSSAGLPGSIAGPGYLAAACLSAAAITLGAIDYYSLPVGKTTKVRGVPFVVLRGAHPEFGAALRAMAVDPFTSTP